MQHLGGGGAPQGRSSEVLGTGHAAVVNDICIFKYIFCANMWCDESDDAYAVAMYVRFLFDLLKGSRCLRGGELGFSKK
jgi:hypothetical protein